VGYLPDTSESTLKGTKKMPSMLNPDGRPHPANPGPSTTTRAHGLRAGRLLGVTALAATSVLGVQSATQAAPPDHYAFSVTDSFADPDVCGAYGFSVDTVLHVDFSVTVKLDSNGVPYQLINHVRAATTLSANGHTVTDIDHFQAIQDLPDGALREVGSVYHVMGPQGLVIRESGQIVYNTDGTITLKGPHPILEGTGTFCSALMP
jgi:hypothetical protein